MRNKRAACNAWPRESVRACTMPTGYMRATLEFEPENAFYAFPLILGGMFGTACAIHGAVIGAAILGSIGLFGGVGMLGYPVRLLMEKGAGWLAKLEKKGWWRGAKATEEISRVELKPLLKQFDRAQPAEQALIGLVLEQCYKNLKRGSNLLAPASLALKQRIQQAAALPKDVQEAAQRMFALYSALFDLQDSEACISKGRLKDIQKAYEALEPEEQQAIVPVLNAALFHKGRTKIPMDTQVHEYLAGILSGSASEGILERKINHLIYTPKGRVRKLNAAAVEKLSTLLESMSPEKAQSWRDILRSSYFDHERVKFGIAPETTDRLWELVAN